MVAVSPSHAAHSLPVPGGAVPVAAPCAEGRKDVRAQGGSTCLWSGLIW